jgi:glutathione reductase (NADPH)
MWNVASIAETFRHAEGYKFTGIGRPTFDWAAFKPARDAYIGKLNDVYDKVLAKDGVEYHMGYAKVLSPTQVEVTRPNNGGSYVLNADGVCIATGGRPHIPSDDDIPGASYGINSDGFFDLTEQPARVAIVGAGYIAVELAGIFNALGTKTHMIIRGETVLRTFDPTIQETLTPWMEHTGIKFHRLSKVVKVEKTANGLVVSTDKNEKVEVDVLLWAIGRRANTENLGLDNVGVKLNEIGDVVVDDYQNSNVKGITSIGDVQGKALLTPVAIAAGRRLANRLFGGKKYDDEKLSYENIPTVVFSYVISSFRRYFLLTIPP